MKLHLAAVLAITALSATLPLANPGRAQVSITISTVLAPPPLPFYEQPAIPAEGYLWAPGYWAWDGDDYYWVPGAWVEPPSVGLLWTPGYWGWRDSVYIYNTGYWGPHVGYYGGIAYGYGYTGYGYEGGYWRGGGFFYNRTVNNITNVQITNVYNKTVVVNPNANNVSFNGGRGGITAAPTPAQLAVAHEPHIVPTASQMALQKVAHSNPQAFVKVNNGKPAAAMLHAPMNMIKPIRPDVPASPAQTKPMLVQPQNSGNVGIKPPLHPQMIARPPKVQMAAPPRKMHMAGPRPKAQMIRPGKPAGARRPPRRPHCPQNIKCQ